MSKKTTVTITILSGITVILIGAGIWLFATGRLVMTRDSTPQGSGSSSAVCDDGVVNTYNKVYSYVLRNGFDVYNVDEAGLKSVVADVKSKSGYQNDPTCQTILFWAAIHSTDQKGAQDAYAAINRLHDEHRFADSNLQNSQPISTYKSVIDGLSTSSQSGGGLGTAN